MTANHLITVPHPTLRRVAQPVSQVDESLRQLVSDLRLELTKTNSRGIGLAAPQINQSQQVFATYINLETGDPDQGQRQFQLYFNPQAITIHSPELSLGPDPQSPTLEGCLSIPGFYGPVPRWSWIEISYQTLVGNQLIDHTQKLEDFVARLVQHEFDHLQGKLFTDYTLEFDLPIYRENKTTGKLIELTDIERQVLTTF